MERLSHKELRSVLEFLRGCYTTRDHDSFVRYVISRLPKLIASDITGYNEVNPDKRKIIWVCDPPDASLPEPQIFERYMKDHPVINYHQRTKEGRARKISDFLTRRQYHRLGLYNEFYRRIDVEYQMVVVLPTESSHIIGIALNRSMRDFSERDRLILNLIRPQLIEAYRNALLATHVQHELTLMKQVTDVLGAGAVVLTGKGHVRLMTRQARQWLKDYFLTVPRNADELPQVLRSWAEKQKAFLTYKDKLPHPTKPLVVEREGKRLVIRLLAQPEEPVLILQEQPAAPDPKDLEPLGLSRREAEVLFWVAQGKTNADTGTILDASARTVGKHLERIYQKLGVETRTAAAMLALTFLG